MQSFCQLQVDNLFQISLEKTVFELEEIVVNDRLPDLLYQVNSEVQVVYRGERGSEHFLATEEMRQISRRII